MQDNTLFVKTEVISKNNTITGACTSFPFPKKNHSEEHTNKFHGMTTCSPAPLCAGYWLHVCGLRAEVVTPACTLLTTYATVSAAGRQGAGRRRGEQG